MLLSCIISLNSIFHSKDVPPLDGSSWTLILSREKPGADARHFFDLENVDGSIFTHVRVTIYPDGGIKRVRLVGKRSTGSGVPTGNTAALSGHANGLSLTGHYAPLLNGTPLSADTFAPYGHVVQAYSNSELAPKGTKVTPANQGSALKFHKLAPLVSSYPQPHENSPTASPGLSVYRCSPLDFDFKSDFEQQGDGWPVRLLERHSYTSQAFVPMGVGSRDESTLEKSGHAYLVVVARNGENDQPDLSTLKAFVAGTSQAVVYAPGVWRK